MSEKGKQRDRDAGRRSPEFIAIKLFVFFARSFLGVLVAA